MDHGEVETPQNDLGKDQSLSNYPIPTGRWLPLAERTHQLWLGRRPSELRSTARS